MLRARFPDTGYIVIVALFSLALVCVLSYFAMPAVDDFCYSAKAKHLGYFDAVAWFYQNWIGRVPATALINLPSAMTETWGVSLVAAYQVISLFMIAMIVWFGVWAGRQFLPGLKGAGLIGLVFAATLIVNARSVGDLLYWLPASASYTVPAVLSGLVFLALIKNAVSGKSLSLSAKSGLTLITFLASGFNEFTSGILIIFVVGSQYMRWRLHTKFDDKSFRICLLAAAVFALVIVMLAPGNSVRLSATGGGDVLGAIVWGPIHFLNYIVLRVDTYGILGWLLFLAILTLIHDRFNPCDAQEVCPIVIWMPVLLWVSATVFMFTAGHYGVNTLLPARTQNEVQFLGGIALSIAVQAGVRRYADSFRKLLFRRNNFLSLRSWMRVSAVLLAVSLGNIKGVLTLTDGIFDFRQEYMTQFELLSTTQEATVSVRHLKTQPNSFLGTILYPGFADYDDCVKSYFGLTAINVIE